MPKLVLVRHGQSLWNLENRFTGWVDVPLTEQGEQEARRTGELLRGVPLDVAYSSALKRAARTLDIILQTIPMELPVISDKALNERDYGDLAGLNKDAMREKYGAEQVHIWRRSFDVRPPGGEALKDTKERTIPFYERAILGDIRQGKNVLVVAHGNSNRSIVMELERLSPDEILALELPTGVARVYELTPEGAVQSVSVLDH
ncbi:MAG: 2,3-bisphosphoglycerate-dependent phosphoglycerate mutase [Fimbriimonadaceae bacterium]|nr:2,3-bisphosphoglycerate-dependent phosphoglycerate mutase [Fimbriimonadaceae bacterium]QYK54738.1 MAG: 2,3-bisphosphoglycerate-dependent phosphoglycerate mutase [Fimbriimonadaceae bacterium]